MKKFKTFIYQQIIPPLLAMLVLTLIMAGTVNQVWGNLELQMRKTQTHVNQALFLNQCRWTLLQIKMDTTQGKTDDALLAWQNLKKIIDKEAIKSANNTELQTLKLFLKNPDNHTRISLFLEHPMFSSNQFDLEKDLIQFQEQTQFITQGITWSILALGLILMGLTAIDLNRLFNDLAKSRELNNTLQEEERRRIAQELHDGVIQELVDLKRAYNSEKVDILVENIRRVCHNLKPQILEDLGFVASLEFLKEDLKANGIATVSLNIDETQLGRIPKDYELTLYRVIQEVFNNIKRRSGEPAILERR
ncbi:MAG: hypothetical protein K2X66_01480, partial [Cyanobacteria bacterium]|nr:hypothetical protein [Cyanobacteriota bacterium]